MSKDERVTKLWSLYQKGLDYQNSIELREKVPMHVRFYEGNQWPKATEATKNLPRPVVNVIKMICRNKKAAILSSPVRVMYKQYGDRDKTDIFNKFAEHVFKELGQEKLDREAIDDAVKKGSYFFHYYWDSEAEGVDGRAEGALRAEIIDPLNIFFENPCQLDEQKQGWILIASRENIDTVRALADTSVDASLIVSDTYENNAYNKKEQDEEKLCTVLTRYFRKDGEIYCEKATKRCVVKEPFPITPDINRARKELLGEEDAPNDASADDIVRGNDIPKAKLFPIVAGYYEKRDGSIYGLSEVEGLIPNQRAINFNIAMSLLNAQECAWGKYVTLPNALKGQKITNVPGQVLVDHTGTGNGIKKMTETSMHALPLELSDSLISQTRNVSGATELLSGEIISANMSGAAIAQLQAQAQMPIEDLRDEFWMVKAKQGMVVAQFLKQFYLNQDFEYEEEDAETHTEVTKKGVFSSKDYRNAKFEVIAEASQGTYSSVASDISILDNLFGKGVIDEETYIRLFPDSAIGNKTDIQRAVQKQREGKLKIATDEISRLTQIIKSQQEIVDSITPTITENERLIASNAELSGKYTTLASEYEKIYRIALAYEQLLKKMGAEFNAFKDEHKLFAETILQNQGESSHSEGVPSDEAV